MTGNVCLKVALVINLRDHVAHTQWTASVISFILDRTYHDTVVDQELFAEGSFSMSVLIYQRRLS